MAGSAAKAIDSVFNSGEIGIRAWPEASQHRQSW